jgi:urease accessory protein
MANTAAIMPTLTATGTAMRIPTETNTVACGSALAQLRLMQLVSPALPIGGFTYSQGLEYAVEAGWIHDLPSLQDWLSGLIEDTVAYLEIPLLARLYQACVADDLEALQRWGRYLLASRETDELRREEQQRARALTRLSIDLSIGRARSWKPALELCQAAPFALAAVEWGIPLPDAALGSAWSWLENQVAAAIKLVPLGQTDGQRVQLALAEALPEAVRLGLTLDDDAIGASSPRLALASSLHETQYTRLFRS